MTLLPDQTRRSTPATPDALARHATNGIRSRMRVAFAGAVLVLVGGCAVGASGAPPTLPTAGTGARPDVEARVYRYGGLFTGRDELMRYQSSIATCMADSGFEYIAWTPQADAGSQADQLDDADGYGVYIEGGTADRPFGDSAGDSADGVDPNDAIVANMSDDERRRYDEALFGTAETRVAVTNDAGREISDVPGSGCVNDAYVEALDGTVQDFSQRAAIIMRPWNELRSSIESDERATAAASEWSACMDAAGYDFRSPEEVKPYLEGLGVDQGAGRSLEIAVHDADTACDESTGFTSTMTRIRAAWELQFLERFPQLAEFGNE